MATTTGGWPYVESTDHPLEYPAVSQQMATQLEISSTQTLGTLTPLAGWVDYGGANAGLHATKQGRGVVLGAMLKPSADTPVTAGSNYSIATVPSAMRPARDTIAPCVYKLSGGPPVLGMLTMTSGAGTVIFTPSTTGTMTWAGAGYVSVSVAYRSV